MTFIVNEETHEVTIKRIEHHDGRTTYDTYVDGEMETWRRRCPRTRLPSPERCPLRELVHKGRFNAIKEL